MINWHEVFHYDETTGLLYWVNSPGVRIKAGSLAGWIDNSGYRRVLYRGVKYQAHRIIWDMLNPGKTLKRNEDIDHIDHDRLNNRPGNLRIASRMLNMGNKTLYRNNRSGVPGVCWRKDVSKWAVRVNSGGMHMHLGLFEDLFEAVCARKSAQNKLSFHRNHGVKL